MSSIIDEKVVQMKFDNQQFEKATAQSMSTLDKLKQKLNLDGAAKGLENIDKTANSISLDGIISSVSFLEKRFSAMGIIGMRVIENLTDSAMNLINKVTNFVKSGIIDGGLNRATKIENARFQLQGLLKDEEAVAAVMQNVKDSVDGTAYSLDAAATVASQLAASGLKAGDEMFGTLRGIAGVAAMTNSSYEDIGRIYATIAGQGRMMGDQLNQLAGRGMNAAAELGKALNKSEAEIRQMVSKGQISFDIFSKAMNEAFGEHAKEANKTFEGAMANTKSALARIGEAFFAPLIKQEGPLVEFFNALRVKINEIKSEILPIIEDLSARVSAIIIKIANLVNKLNIKGIIDKVKGLNSVWGGLFSVMEKLGFSTDTFKKKLIEAAREAGIPIDALMYNLGGIENVLKKGKLGIDVIKNAIKKCIDMSANGIKVVDEVTGSLTEFQDIVNQVIRGNFGNGEDRIKKLTEAGYEQAKVQKLVNMVWKRNGKTWDNTTISAEELAATIGDMTDAEAEAAGFTAEQTDAFKELAKQAEETGVPIEDLILKMAEPDNSQKLFISIGTIIRGLMQTLSALKEAFIETFSDGNFGGGFSWLIDSFYNLTQHIEVSDNAFSKLKRTFKGVFAAIDIIATILNGAFRIGLAVVNGILESLGLDLLDVTANIGDAIVALRNWIKQHDFFTKAANSVGKAIGEGIKWIKKYIDAFMQLPQVSSTIQKFKDKFKDVHSITDFFNVIKRSIDGFLDNFPKLKDNFLNFGHWITEGLSIGIQNGLPTVWEAIKTLANGIKEWFCSLLHINSPSKDFIEYARWIIMGLVEGINQFIDLVAEAIGKVVDKIKSKFEGVNWSKVFATGLIGALVGTVVKVIGIAGKLATAAENLTKPAKSFAGFIDGLHDFTDGLNKFMNNKKIIKSVSKVIKSFGSVLSGFAMQLKAKALLDMAKAILVLVAAIAILYLLASDPGKLAAVVGVIILLIAVMGAAMLLSTYLSKNQDKISALTTSAGSIGQMAVAIGGIIAAIYTIGKVIKMIGTMNPEQAEQGMQGFVGILIYMGLFLAAMQKFVLSKVTPERMRATEQLGEFLTRLSITFGIMTACIYVLGKMKPEEVLQGTGILMGFGFLIIAFFEVASKLTPARMKQIVTMGDAAKSLSGAIALLGAMVIVLGIMPEGVLKKGIIAVAGLSAIVLGLMYLAKKIGGADMGNIAKCLISISLAIAILGGIAILLGLVPAKNLYNGVKYVGYLAAMCLALLFAVKQFGLKEAEVCSKTLLSISAAIGIMAICAIALSIIDGKSLAKGVFFVGLLAVMAIAITRMAGEVKGSEKTMFGIAALIGTLTVCAILLGFINQDKLWNGIKAIAALSALVMGIEYFSKYIGDSMKTVIALTILVGVMTGCIWILSSIPFEQAMGAAKALSLLMITMGISMAIIGKFGTLSTQAMISLGVMTLVVIALGAMIGFVCSLSSNLDQAMPVAGAISILLLAMSVSLVIIGLVGAVATSAIPALLVMTLTAVILGAMLGAVCSLSSNLDQAMPVALAISTLLLAMSASLILLSIVGLLGVAALIGIGVLDVLIADLAVLFAGFGALITAFPELETFIDKGIPLLVKLGDGLGQFLGSIVGGFMEQVSESLITVADNLGAFAEHLTPFINGIKAVDDSVLDSTLKLAAVIIALTAADLISGILSFIGIGPDFDKFGESVAKLGEPLKAFNDSIIGIDCDNVKNGANAALALVQAVDAMPKSGGWLQKLTGENSFSDFSAELKNFGPNLKAFGDSVAGLNCDDIVNACTAAKALTEFADSIPNEGGYIANVTGDNSLGKFSAEIVPFGNSLKQYGGYVAGLNCSDITASCNAAKSLTEFADSIPNEGGYVAKITGDNSLAKFSSEIVPFGNSLKQYGEYVAGLNCGDIIESCKAASGLVEFANAIPEEGGWKAVFAGDNTLSDFGVEMVEFGGYLVDYVTKIANVDFAALYNSVTSTNRLLDLMNNMASFDEYGVESFSRGLSALGYAGVDEFILAFDNSDTNLITAATNMLNTFLNTANSKKPDFSTTFSGLATEGLNALNSQTNQFISAGAAMMNGVSSGISNTSGSVSRSIYNVINTSLIIIKNKYIEFNSAGKSLTKNLGDGVEQNQNGIIASFNRTLTSVLTAIRNRYGSFKADGGYMVEGFAAGLDGNVSKAYAAAVRLAKKALEGLEKTLDINSPSKEADTDGAYFDEGLANGINNNSDQVEDAASNLGDSLLYTTESSIDSSLDAQEDGQVESTKSYLKYTKGALIALKGFSITCENLVNARWNKEIGAEEAAIAKKTDLRAAILHSEGEYINKLYQYSHTEQEVTDLRKKNAQERAEAMKAFEGDIVQQTTDLLNKYTDALKSNTDSLMGNSKLFEEVSQKEATSIQTILKNMEEHRNETLLYSDTLASLNEKFADDTQIRDYLDGLGEDNLATLLAINSSSEEELGKFSALFHTTYQASAEAASQELAGMKTNTEQELANLLGIATPNLEQFAGAFNGTFQSITDYCHFSAEQMASVKASTGELINAMSEGMSVDLMNPKPSDIGKNIVDGTAEGMKDTSSVETAGKNMMIDTVNATRDIAGISSPSDMFEKQVGVYIPQGVGVGIDKGSEAGATDSPIDAMSNMLGNMVETSTSEENMSQFEDVGTGIVSALTGSMNSEESTTAMSGGLDTLLSSCTVSEESTSNFSNIGTGLVTSIAEPLSSEDSSATVSTGMNTMLSSCTVSAENEEKFTGIGTDIVTDITSSLTSETSITAMSTSMNTLLSGCAVSDETKAVFTTMGTNMVSDITASLNSEASATSMTTSMNTLLSGCSTIPAETTEKFKTVGQGIVTSLTSGVTSQQDSANTSFTTLLDGCLVKIREQFPLFVTEGENLSNKITEGSASKSDSVKDKFVQIMSDCITGIRGTYSDFKQAGSYVIDGLVEGINENRSKAIKAAVNVAVDAYEAACDALGVESPSKKFYAIGNYCVEGMANGLEYNAHKAVQASSDVAKAILPPMEYAIKSAEELIDKTPTMSLTIRPVLDMDNFDSDISKLKANYSSAQAMTIDTSMNKKTAEQNQNGVNVNSGSTYQFTQNNYSPKSLSRIDIYRQTKNQFTALERMANA